MRQLFGIKPINVGFTVMFGAQVAVGGHAVVCHSHSPENYYTTKQQENMSDKPAFYGSISPYPGALTRPEIGELNISIAGLTSTGSGDCVVFSIPI